MMMPDAGTPAARSAFLMSGWSNSTYRVELVVSGRIAAILPLPEAASDFRAATAGKSWVNDDGEIDGAAAADLVPAADDVVPPPAAADELVDDDDEFELPHAAIASAPDTANAATNGLLLSKCTMAPPPCSRHAHTWLRVAARDDRHSDRN